MSVEAMILELPRAEKLRLMESLWVDLSRQPDDLQSPAWHQEVLRKTEERLAAGEEGIMDWEDAKAQLTGGK